MSLLCCSVVEALFTDAFFFLLLALLLLSFAEAALAEARRNLPR